VSLVGASTRYDHVLKFVRAIIFAMKLKFCVQNSKNQSNVAIKCNFIILQFFVSMPKTSNTFYINPATFTKNSLLTLIKVN
jgi:hypothetical protein